MSRLGKIPITLPKGVSVEIADGLVNVKGPKGSLQLQMGKGISVKKEDTLLWVLKEGNEENKKFHGLYRALLGNMVHGVTEGFEKRLQLIGVGYRASVSGNTIDLKVGFSHPTVLKIPQGINVKVEKSTEIIISGIDSQLVGQFAANIRSIKKPEPYKGKGIRYKGEYVRKKAGKSAAKGK